MFFSEKLPLLRHDAHHVLCDATVSMSKNYELVALTVGNKSYFQISNYIRNNHV